MLNSDVTAHALLAFRNNKTGRMDFTSHSVLATPVEGGYTLGAGRAFSEGDKEALLDLLLNVESGVEFIDTSILVKSRNVLAWYNPPQKIDILFKGVAYNAPIPGLIYIAGQGKLRCYAYKGKSRPTPDTKLYYAPMGNMYRTGSFCTGNCETPKDNTIASIPGWERFVLKCVNTHTGSVKVLKSAETYEQFLSFYKGLEESKCKAFPSAELMPANTNKVHLTLRAALQTGDAI